MKVMIAVTHLLGTGHLRRAMVLARAFGAQGHKATVVSGGLPMATESCEGVRIVQLPAVRSNGADFSILLDDAGREVSADLMAARCEMLLGTFHSVMPDAVITELFPFGRRILRKEFLALLGAARERSPAPRLYASIRDILAPPSKARKIAFAQQVVDDYLDGVLVHADPSVTSLERSWPVSQALAGKLRYTGFVSPAPAGPHPARAGEGEILVSAGGGAVGTRLYQTAKAAAALDPERRWRLLVGGSGAAALAATLRDGASANLIAEPARPDFRQMLNHAAASVSLCGYNTALDLLQAGCPAVLVPYDAGNEVEQVIRARALALQQGFDLLMDAALDPHALLARVDHVIAQGRGPHRAIRTDGAAETVRIVTQEHEARDAD